MPVRARWQPLRIGLVELFRYDSEEFWFRDGHLLLRGNNGTGKSKVLALTLPFLLDADLRPSRIEPDGDPGKRMAWNLLLNEYDRRIGYAWVEFGRMAEDGTPHYLTLGAGLSAAAARPQIDSWYFIVEDAPDAPRLGQDIWLTSAQRVVLTKERLREVLDRRGQVFDTATGYRRAVDERLFRLGQTRYAAMVDTLIQLRQPQLSKKPDEASLSHALTEALPPLAADLLSDVAEALNQLEEDRRQLEEYQALERTVSRFNDRYRLYAGTQTRRQARSLRQAQTEFDNASRALNEAQARLHEAHEAETRAQQDHETAARDVARERARLDTLRSDPTMQDANRLDGAAREMQARQRAVAEANAALEAAADRLRRARDETGDYAARAGQAEAALADRRARIAELAEAVGLASQCAENPLVALDTPSLVELPPRMFETGRSGLRALASQRREHIARVRDHIEQTTRAEMRLTGARQSLDGRREEADAAADRRRRADDAVEHEGQALVERWETHLAGLRQLRLDADAALAALGDWIAALEGGNPASHALQVAQQQASQRQAAQRIELQGRLQTVHDEAQALTDEHGRLTAGEDAAPPVPHTRAEAVRDGRPGAPLWQLLEFRAHVDAACRAGLEAALEAAGLLDAWMAPDGALQTFDGRVLHDVQAVPRPRQSASLADWLEPASVVDSAVPSDIVARVLTGIACGPHDPADAEAWVAPDGRFRFGPLTGAWDKPAAVYIGFAARAAARARRLAEIADRLAQLADAAADLQAQLDRHAEAERTAAAEWRDAPSDTKLREAHLAAAAGAREFQAARERMAAAETQYRAAEQALRDARQALEETAADLRLPHAAEGVRHVETTLGRFDEAQQTLAAAAHELRLAVPELRRQQGREAEAHDDMQQRQQQLSVCRTEAEEAAARWSVLRDTVGAKVEELRRQLEAAEQAVHAGQQAADKAAVRLRKTGEARAVADRDAAAATAVQQDRADSRARAVVSLQRFAMTGLLSAALPDIELPDLHSPWTIDPALTLARRAEQSLSHVNDSDEIWARLQRQTSEDLTELQRGLTALGQQTHAETTDYGLIVNVVYQNRPERPDKLVGRLTDEIAQRQELLSAKEREVLENHLQAEIATAVQRLLQAAERQVDAINKELHKRPTSTGVRYRLQWLPLPDGSQDAPVGLEAARKRLLNTSTDLWSAEDRRVVGTMLQQRIAAEREHAEASGGSSLLEQLSRALDYRRWHEFRVQRWQDGQWRKLSGPASSGERALGLTVPLFAAVASFYSQSSYANAPRLVLLDEAFAGIDAAARAHCMALIREFDLDFVITSESEWACYAELPGVAICNLHRREGIDAVFVSRWNWDGRARVSMNEPDRRFQPE
ncbi:MAG TPA: TIGR02680 family protein [Acetobacteraceae bacterium]